MSGESPESQFPGRVPEVLDAWRMVAARRGFEGSLPLSSLSRLRDVLCEGGPGEALGDVRFAIGFDRDALQVPYVELRIDAALPLECQRTLQRFLQPVQLVQRLGLIRDEAEEAGLPEGYEPRVGDVLKRVDGQLFEVFEFTTDKKGVECHGVDEPVTLYVLREELRKEFTALVSRRSR